MRRLSSLIFAASLACSAGARAQDARAPLQEPVEETTAPADTAAEAPAPAPTATPPPTTPSTTTPTTPAQDEALAPPADPADRPGRSPSSLGLALLGGGAALGAVTAVASVMVESFANDTDDPLTNDLVAQSAGFVSLGLASASIAMALVGGGLILQETLVDAGPAPAAPAGGPSAAPVAAR